MKAVFPKNIKKWLLAGLSLTVWPISISIVQFFILAIGLVVAFVLFNSFQKVNRVVGVTSAVLAFLIFLVIAFFKISEMNLLHFVVKVIQSYFIDTSEKYQTNYAKPDPLMISLQKNKTQEGKQKIEYKTGISLEGVDVLDKSGLL